MRILSILTIIFTLSITAANAQQESSFAEALREEGKRLSYEIIQNAHGHEACPEVLFADIIMTETNEFESLRATCSNGEVFRIYQIPGAPSDMPPLAMKCSAALELGVEGC